MFIGHFGVGLGAKKAAPSLSLGILFISAQFLDLLWPTLLLLNLEHAVIDPANKNQPLIFTDYPISHSLLMVLVWSLLFGLIGWLWKRNIRIALVLALCVLSHWVLDLIVHFPDLPLYPGHSPMVGLGLWQSLPLTAVVEGSIFIIGLILYLQTTKAKNAVGRIGFWVLILLLVFSHIASIIGPAPASMNAVAWGAQLQWIFVFLAFWVDKNRDVR